MSGWQPDLLGGGDGRGRPEPPHRSRMGKSGQRCECGATPSGIGVAFFVYEAITVRSSWSPCRACKLRSPSSTTTLAIAARE